MNGDAPYSEGQVLAGKLKIVRLLGAGGMGAVYEVEHTFTKHRRALKLLHGDMARIPAVVARFLREASAAGHIGNPHIVETFDAGQLETGEPYLVMELLQGESLSSLLEAQRPLPLDLAIEIVGQACDGVQAAHDAGIVHRDLKPDNLFLVQGERTFVKLLDFGISKFDPERTGNQGITQEGSALGTPYYMPPEQVLGKKDIDGRSDVYSLGVVLYECLTGEKPFLADSLPHLSVLIHEGRYAPVSQRRGGMPVAVDQIVARAMSVNRDQRFADPRAMAIALRGLAGQQAPAQLGLDATLAGGPVSTPTLQHGSADVAPEPPLAAAGQTAQHTMGGATSALEPEPRASSRGALLGVGAVAAVALGAYLAFGRAPAPAPAAAAESHRSGATTAEPGPEVTPVVAAPSTNVAAPAPLPSASVAPAAATPRTAGSNAKVAPAPAPAPAPRTGTRANQHGLATDNPL